MAKSAKKSLKGNAKKAPPKKGPTKTYNEFKRFEGEQYTGMMMAKAKWHYEQGDWKGTRITPGLREVSYALTKRRAGMNPKVAF
jgi:hypothetical protein